MSKIKNIESNWTALGNSDPYWAVITDNRYINNKWNKSEFYNSGEKDFEYIFKDFKKEITFPKSTVLDFGCGPGRLTFQFAKHTEKVIGVDISAPMINLARETKMFEKKCTFIVNNKDNLKIINSDSIDLVFSFIALQHNPPELIKNYLLEFIRIVIKDGGQIFFNLVSSPPQYYKILYFLIGNSGLNLLRKLKYNKKSIIEMHWIKDKEVISIFSNNGFKLKKKTKDQSVGKNWSSYFYLFEKNKDLPLTINTKP